MVVPKPKWMPYEAVANGHLPLLRVNLARGDVKSTGLRCLVDTGSNYTIVPKHFVSSFLRESDPKEQDMGARDANGNPLRGIPIGLDVAIPLLADIPAVRETVWVCPSGYWPLLGQTILEKFGANFQNFPNSAKGRRFTLYPRPDKDLGSS